MATPPRKHLLSPKARRALGLLASNALGATEALDREVHSNNNGVPHSVACNVERAESGVSSTRSTAQAD
jgi:hypothetical protein